MADVRILQRYFVEIPRLSRMVQYHDIVEQLRDCQDGDESVCQRFITADDVWSAYENKPNFFLLASYASIPRKVLPQSTVLPPEVFSAGFFLLYVGLAFAGGVDFARYQRALTEEQNFIILPELPDVCLESCHVRSERQELFDRFPPMPLALTNPPQPGGWEGKPYPHLSRELDELYELCNQSLNRNVDYNQDELFLLLRLISIITRQDPLCPDVVGKISNPFLFCADLLGKAKELNQLEKEKQQAGRTHDSELGSRLARAIQALLEELLQQLRDMLCQ